MMWFRWLGFGLVVAVLALAPPPASAYDAPSQELNNLLTLPLAASNDDFNAVLILLSRGTSVDTEGRQGRAALSFAAGNGDVQIADL
jgi:ankyrin repeat protein